MGTVNAIITSAFDLFFAPFARANPWYGLVAVSVISGALLILIFRYTSNQQGLRAVKGRIIGQLLEVVLYRDELGVVLRAQLGIFRDNLRYLFYALVPLAFMVAPVALLYSQIDLRYGHRPLKVGEQFIFSVKLSPEAGPLEEAAISAPADLKLETPGLRMPAEREVDWRLVGSQPGRYELRFRAGGHEYTKAVVVGVRGGRISVERLKDGLGRQLLNPGEPVLPADAPVEWMRVSYPEASFRLLWWRHWIWSWLILSMLIGYALKGPLRIQV
jgi:hypothetical protein